MTEVKREIWRDGAFIPWAEATVHVMSQSLQRGSLAFDYLSVHQTSGGDAIIFRLDDHIARLFETCRIMGIPIVWKPQELLQAAKDTVSRNPGATSLKISALIPSIEAELVPQDPTISVYMAAYDSRSDIIDRHDAPFVERPTLKLKVEHAITNRREDIIPPQAKVAANYTSPMFAKWRARKQGFDDIILLDADELVTEAPTSNLFIVNDDKLVTPPSLRVLLGITRSSIMVMTERSGLACTERDIKVDELFAADEVFLTSTSVGVKAVVRIDDQAVGNGEPGPVTRRLKDQYDRIVTGEDAGYEAWLTRCGAD